MAHIRNDEFYLYTGFTADGNKGYEAFEFLTNAGLPFRHLHYGDPSQHPDVLGSIASWFPDRQITVTFPFVTYSKNWEVTDPMPRTPEIVLGLDNIKNTDWNALKNFQGE
jgi:hypothetical protein